MNVHADPHRCVGAGQCALRAPEVFDQDEEQGTVVVPRPSTEQQEAVTDAVALCPSGAITVDTSP